MVWPKCPAIPRTPSWVAAHAPSRLTDTARAPERAIRLIMAGVSRGVTEGDRQTGTPADVAYLTRSNRSGRSRQSPPVRTRIGYGRPNPATWSMRSRPSARLSSPGGGTVVALARQCRQASRQARVVSQNTSIGRWPKFTGVRDRAGNAALAGIPGGLVARAATVISSTASRGCRRAVAEHSLAWRGHHPQGPRSPAQPQTAGDRRGGHASCAQGPKVPQAGTFGDSTRRHRGVN